MLMSVVNNMEQVY